MWDWKYYVTVWNDSENNFNKYIYVCNAYFPSFKALSLFYTYVYSINSILYDQATKPQYMYILFVV